MIGPCLIQCKAHVETVTTFLLASLREDSEQSISLMCLMQMQSCNIQQKNQIAYTKNVGTQEKDQLPAKFYGVPFNRPEAWKDCFCLLLRHRHPKKTLLKIKLCIYESNF